MMYDSFFNKKYINLIDEFWDSTLVSDSINQSRCHLVLSLFAHFSFKSSQLIPTWGGGGRMGSLLGDIYIKTHTPVPLVGRGLR
jgi:hypothetical protein